MVNQLTGHLDRTFAALADPTRRAILRRLRRGACRVGELAEPFAMSLPAVSKHLRVLERAGLLQQDRRGRVRRCTLNAAPMQEAAEWVNAYREFWQQQLGSLAAFLEAEDTDLPDDAEGRASSRKRRRTQR